MKTGLLKLNYPNIWENQEMTDAKAPLFYIVNQHVGWLKQYVLGMDMENWRDMQNRAAGQLEILSAELDKIEIATAPQALAAMPAVGGEREELIDGLEGLSQLLSKENTGSDAGFDDICWRAAQALRAAQPAPQAAIGGEARKWIIDLIHNEYDPKPSDYRPGDNWNDGAEEIADKIIGCLAQPASPLRGRESLAAMFLSMWKAGRSPLQIADAFLSASPPDQPAADPVTGRSAPLSCPNCFDETDCSQIDICNAINGV